MSDVAKWALLAAAIAGLVAMISSLGIIPDSSMISNMSNGLNTITSVAGNAFLMARGFINTVLPSWAIPIFTIVFVYVVGRPFVTFAFRSAVKIIHYIYK